MAAHELVHRLIGPTFDLSGSYNNTPNLMNANQAQAAGWVSAVTADWWNPNAATGFASLSSSQVQMLYTKCSKAHPPANSAPGGSPGGGGGSGGVGYGGGGYPGWWYQMWQFVSWVNAIGLKERVTSVITY